MLNNRLRGIKNMIPHGTKFVLDVGTDHSYLPITLIQEEIASYVIASDISVFPLEDANENIRKHGLEECIETRLGDGLQVLNENEYPDLVVIAGVSGEGIVKILQEGYNKLEFDPILVLQAMEDSYSLRKYLLEIGYNFDKEVLISDKKRYYQIIRSIREKGYKNYSKLELEYGPQILKNPTKTLKEFLEKELAKINRVINNVNRSSSKDDEIIDKKNKFVKRYHDLQEVYRNAFSHEKRYH
ncbi:tRNA (adenine(22)-N(1))-methyltransferase [Natranaerobius trueperi]|uniref:SAM-dependent methyltransferase n=1 Tax=Natranaerobius trueperi TaxID=759412 RepID=A0A226BY03_9FIRM|nr:class I SAM-dependent methyltransferase [Natranaerobius trueperi]OWZ83079.1 SAM-dependent methyltransferase [Natranaerobius trueperi]